MKVAFVSKHYQLGCVETIVHQLFHCLPARSIGTKTWISEFARLPTHQSVRPLYPAQLNRMQHSHFVDLTKRFLPRREWTAREFEAIRRCDCNVFHVHVLDETYAGIEALVELANAKPMALTLHEKLFGRTQAHWVSSCLNRHTHRVYRDITTRGYSIPKYRLRVPRSATSNGIQLSAISTTHLERRSAFRNSKTCHSPIPCSVTAFKEKS
jgi:hypothetical protein